MRVLSEIVKDLNKAENDYDFSNHHLIRFFRCFLDGSYKGFEHYQANQRAARELSSTDMKSHLMSEFKEYLETDNVKHDNLEIIKLFENKRFYTEMTEAIYGLVEQS